MFSRTALIVAAASAGVSFIAYCIYFDRKRRSDPDFPKKLRERKYLFLSRSLIRPHCNQTSFHWEALLKNYY